MSIEIASPPVEATSIGARQRRILSLRAAVLQVRSVDFRQALFFAYVAVALLVFTFVAPPFQKPDEPNHFYRTVSVTNLDLVCSVTRAGPLGFEMKRKYKQLPDAVLAWQVRPLHGSSFNADYLNVGYLAAPQYQVDIGVYNLCNLPPFGYLPNALGLAAGKPFSNPLVPFYLARLAGALFFVAAIVWALRVTPPQYRLPVYAYAALPTVLHQVSAINYDVVQLSLAPLLFAYVTRFAVDDRTIRASTLLIFLGLLFWSVHTRTLSYLPLLLLFFAVRPRNLAPDFRRYAELGVGFFAFTAGTVLLVSLVYLPHTGSPWLSTDVNGIEQLRFVFHNPLAFLEAFYNALRYSGELVLMESIGLFGWNDAPMSDFSYYLIVFAAGAVLFHLARRERVVLPPVHTAAVLATVAVTTLSIYLSLYAVWTPVGSNVIEGVQGRYLVGLLPFAAFGGIQAAAYIGKARFLNVLLVLLALVMLYNLYRAIDVRYFF